MAQDFQLDRELGSTFDKIAREYDAIRPTYPKECIDSVREYSGLTATSRILEVGCGTGQATSFFLDAGHTVNALDIGQEMIGVAREKFRGRPAHFAVASFEEAAFPDDYYDLIFSATAFHWVDPTVRYIKSARLLKAGGTLALFWNIDTRQGAPVRDAIDQVYREVVPEEPDDRKRQSNFLTVTLEIKDEVEASGLFHSLQVRRHPWSMRFSTAEYLRLIATYSYHRALSEAKQTELIRGIGEAVDSNGGLISIQFENVTVLAKK